MITRNGDHQYVERCAFYHPAMFGWCRGRHGRVSLQYDVSDGETMVTACGMPVDSP